MLMQKNTPTKNPKPSPTSTVRFAANTHYSLETTEITRTIISQNTDAKKANAANAHLSGLI